MSLSKIKYIEILEVYPGCEKSPVLCVIHNMYRDTDIFDNKINELQIIFVYDFLHFHIGNQKK